MKKAIFKYKKEDGLISQRLVLQPNMIKESSNYLKDFENPNVNYINGFELDKSITDSNVISEYEKMIELYFNIKFPTLEEFLLSNGLDPNKVKTKSFKKEGISDLQLL